MRRYLLVFLAFLPMAAIGTTLHESGHYLAALAAGLHPTLHYGWVKYAVVPPPPIDVVVTAAGPLANTSVGTLGRTRAATR